MSDLAVSLPVVFFFLAVVAGLVWILNGLLAQRDEISAVKGDSSGTSDVPGQTS